MSYTNPKGRRVKSAYAIVYYRNDCGECETWVGNCGIGSMWNKRDALRAMKKSVAETLDVYDISMKHAKANYKCLYSEMKDQVYLEIPVNNVSGGPDCIVLKWKVIKL